MLPKSERRVSACLQKNKETKIIIVGIVHTLLACMSDAGYRY